MNPLARRLQAQLAATGAGCNGRLKDDTPRPPRDMRDAAVLIAITDRANPGVLLTVRPQTMAAHPGQVAFPGGKLEPGETPLAAALREAHEELAVPPAAVDVAGLFAPFATGSGFNLTAVVGVIPADLDIAPDRREVADWFEPPLGFVLDPRNHRIKQTHVRGYPREYYEMLWQGYRIWGITAGLLRHLSKRLNWCRMAK